MLTYAIGDLHGRFDLLQQALKVIHVDAGPQGGTFIVLGDFIDRGPQSRECVELLMAGPQLPNWQWIVLQGNHESMALEALTNLGVLNWWQGNGGTTTLKSYGYQHGDRLLPLKVPLTHRQWLAGLPVWHEDEHRIYVHAGVPSHLPVEQTKIETLQWMLHPSADSYPDAEVHADLPHCSGKHVVHGHVQHADHPLLLPHRTNLDSWAYYTNRSAIGVFSSTVPGGPVRVLQALGRSYE